jgi:hypothetical protein
VAFLANDEVVMHGNAQRLGDFDDRLRHLDVGEAWGGVSARVIVHEPTRCPRTLKSEQFAVFRKRARGCNWGRFKVRIRDCPGRSRGFPLDHFSAQRIVCRVCLHGQRHGRSVPQPLRHERRQRRPRSPSTASTRGRPARPTTNGPCSGGGIPTE